MVDALNELVRLSLGPAYDPKATYKLVRPGMVALPKYADYEKVGEVDEDTRAGTKLVVLRARPAPPRPVAPISPIKPPPATAMKRR